jgi:hypothetical protein
MVRPAEPDLDAVFIGRSPKRAAAVANALTPDCSSKEVLENWPFKRSFAAYLRLERGA